ncbi:Bifunctional protein RIB2 [Cyphellophora attinorum]|uniref:Bifunctional protein RIB2 n=1 Tax=Cyphellophora attinorum TaxID=1664694 RepID=A0A0N1NXK5_9EURO|nr:Bifunctional protein RIB2 [Phialophora attinorum]KPI38325.1 Bifunctional protein RIB2 [Phialophora attinorum]
MSHGQHVEYLRHALSEAQKSPPKPTNFRVGCVLVSYRKPQEPQILSTGYTLELEGNTHAEQCALTKMDEAHPREGGLPNILTQGLKVTLYTTLEPCSKRLSGNTPCVQRIIDTRQGDPEGGVRKVVFGAKEPNTFVQDSQSCRLLTEAGVEWEYIPDLEQEILAVAMEGHDKKESSGAINPSTESSSGAPAEQRKEPTNKEDQVTNIDDISLRNAKGKKNSHAIP